jgi:chromosome segregation ATPase
VLPEEVEREERDDHQRLRTLEGRFEALLDRRRTLLGELRKLSSEQRTLVEQRQTPQTEVERLYEAHGQLGRQLSELRAARDAARRRVEESVVRKRELLLTFDRSERERPDQIRRELAELELRQQTHALKIDEENALIARLRRRSADLKEAEARIQVVAAHESLRKEADLGIASARAEVDRLGEEFRVARAARDAAMTAIREKHQAAGALVAELRAKGKARAEVIRELNSLGQELDSVDREGRELLARSRARRAEAMKTLRQYSARRRQPDEALASIADAHLEELLKRGKVTL